MARPPFEPTEKQRALVKQLAMIGTPQELIAQCVEKPDGKSITEKTLRKHFRRELDTAGLLANATIGGTIFRVAANPDHPHWHRAAWMWSFNRMGWHRQARGNGGEDDPTAAVAELVLETHPSKHVPGQRDP